MVTVIIFTKNSGLQSENLLPTRGVAASGFPPLCNIPHCCLPQESGPCLSPNVAVQPLSPATDRRLGEPLPHQLSNRTRAHLQADCSFDLCAMRCCGLMRYYHPFPGAIPLLKAGCSRVTHPSATKNTSHLPEGFSPAFSVRLACVRRAASVRPEPGSNS